MQLHHNGIITALCMCIPISHIQTADTSQQSKNKQKLYRAVEKNEVQTIRRLLNAGTKVNIHESKSGNTPLHVAAANGFVDAINELAQNKRLRYNIRNNTGNTPLHVSAARGHLQATQALIAEPTSPFKKSNTHMENKNKEKASDLARKNKHENVAQFLEEQQLHDPIIPGFTTYEGHKTTSHIAAEKGQKAVVKAMIEDGTFAFNTRDADGNTPLHVAAKKGHMKIINMIAQDPRSVSTHIVNNDNKVPTEVAQDAGHQDAAETLSSISMESSVYIKDPEVLAMLHKHNA